MIARSSRCIGSLLIAVALVVPAVGCGGSLSTSTRLRRARTADACAHVPDEFRVARGGGGGEDAAPDAASSALSIEMPASVRRVAEAARLDDAQLADRTYVLERVLLLQAELGAAEAELSCLDDQLETLQEELASNREDFELAFTLASIAVGALGSIVAGVLELSLPDSPAAPIAGIVGGVASAGLGLVAFWAPRESVELEHERNLLAALRGHEAIEDGLLSGFVLRALDAPRGTAPSARDALRAAWEESLAELDPRALEILFGPGGRYDADLLAAREVALEQLETEILQIRQDLELLLRFLYQTTPARTEPD